MSGCVELFTGLPGSGKTAQLVDRIVELHEKEPGRPVFQIGINGLKEGLAIPLTEDMLSRWWELPPGSIICIDECQEDGSHPDQPVCLMPKDRGVPSQWVQRITKVRHHGMTFLLTTQNPANMSAYVRRLVDHHVHAVVRAKGVRQVYTWQRCMDDPDSRSSKKTGEMSFSPVPKRVFDLYKSSSLHTMKVRTPRIWYVAGAMALAGLFLAFYIPHKLHKTLHPDTPASLAMSDSHAASDGLRIRDFGAWSKPRTPGIPWTAPMFDKLEVKAQPRLFCIAVDDGRCSCLTEQGTRYAVDPKTCRLVAANGIYNPFAEPREEHADVRGVEQPAGRRTAASLPAGQPAAPPVVMAADAGVQRSSGLRVSYAPPTTLPWNAEGG
jgi:zona occludens toxin